VNSLCERNAGPARDGCPEQWQKLYKEANMSRNERSKSYIDKSAISRALVRFVRDRLMKEETNGSQPTTTRIAGEIGVTQEMVSQVQSRKKALSYETVAKYAGKIGRNVGELYKNLTEVAREMEGGRPTPVPGMSAKLRDLRLRAYDDVQTLEQRIWRSIGAASQQPEVSYESAVTWAYRAFHDSNVPVVAAGTGFRRSGVWDFLACNGQGKRNLQAVWLTQPVAPEFVAILNDCCRNSQRGELSVEGRVTRPAANEAAAYNRFWEDLTGACAPADDRRFPVWVKAVLPVPNQESDSAAADALVFFFLFEYRFDITDDARHAMWLFADVVPKVYIRQLPLSCQRAPLLPGRGFSRIGDAHCLRAPSRSAPDSSRAWLGDMVRQFFAKIVPAATETNAAFRVEIWLPDGSCDRFVRLAASSASDDRDGSQLDSFDQQHLSKLVRDWDLTSNVRTAMAEHIHSARTNPIRACNQAEQNTSRRLNGNRVVCLRTPIDIGDRESRQAIPGLIRSWCRKQDLKQVRQRIASAAADSEGVLTVPPLGL